MIIATCGICKSKIKKNKADGPGCNICGFGMESQTPVYIPCPIPYPVYPVYPEPYPWYYIPSTTFDGTGDMIFSSPKIIYSSDTNNTSNTLKM